MTMSLDNNNPHKIHLILESIRSLHNVGAIFRTAEVFGVEKLWLIGYSGILRPQSSRDVARLNPKLAKTDMGTSKIMPWEHSETIKPVIQQLKTLNTHILALEQHPTAISLSHFTPPPTQSIGLIVGHELHGVSKLGLTLANQIVEIPQRGTHSSLNVATACGIALYHLTSTRLT